MLKNTLIAIGLITTIMALPVEAKNRGRLASRSGYASWYNHMNGRKITASRDWPCGTKIKVTNAANHKSVIVTVRDWGPAKWTGRDLDLNRPAFNSIAPLGQGEVKVKYRILSIGKCRMHRH